MTEPERLRGEARRALKVARAINDEKATKSLEAGIAPAAVELAKEALPTLSR
jgi:hypothetical protein